MKRVNIEDAFVGEPTSRQANIEAQDSDEAIIIAIRGGELVVVVPSGTLDEGAVGLSAIGGVDYMGDRRTAGEIMIRDVVTARRDLPTAEFTALLAFHNVSEVPVLDEAGTVIGVVARRTSSASAAPRWGRS